jgi:hypothetical protein
MYFQLFMARLKSCPDTKHEFFRSLFSRALIQSQNTEMIRHNDKSPISVEMGLS